MGWFSQGRTTAGPSWHERDTALHEVRQALLDVLASAPPEEVPGLQRALAVLADHVRTGDPELDWVRQVIAAQGLNPHREVVRSVKAVRDARPGLELAEAKRLVDRLRRT